MHGLGRKIENGDKIVIEPIAMSLALGGPIEVAHVDENYVIVSKPSTIPVHPCGLTIITLLYTAEDRTVAPECRS